MATGIKVRAKLSDGATTVKALMSHPMETGSRKDKKTGELIPAHFIQEVSVKHNGADVVTADWSGGVSKNPYLSVVFNGGAPGDKVTVSWKDNQGGGEEESTEIS